MGLPEELYCAMLEVGHCARRHKIPEPLAHTMIDIAQKSLELWRQDKTAMRFAAGMLAGPTNLRATTGQLSQPVASHVGGSSGCWNTLVAMADSKLSALYYRPRGYWKGFASRSWRLQQRWPSSRPRTGSKGMPSGRSICLPHGVYRS